MNNPLRLSIFALLLSVPGLLMAAEADALPRGPLPGDPVPLHYRLNLEILPNQPRFSGSVEIDIRVAEPLTHIWMHGRDLDVNAALAIDADGREIGARFEQVTEDGVARLDLDRPLPAGEAMLRISWTAEFGKGLTGLYHVRVDNDDYAFTQLESISARRMFPGFDEPAYKTPFDISVVARAGDAVLGNTLVQSVAALPGDLTRTVFSRTPPLPTYLLALAIGPLDVVEWIPVPPSSVRKQPLPLRGAAVRGQGARLRWALENTANILIALEEYFAYPYPFDKLDLVAVPDFAAGAMENAGLITYREPLLLFNDNPPVNQQRFFGAVHAHELAHQWFGNLVTMPWWDDIWLNEASASWMQAKIAQQWNPAYHFDRDTQSQAIWAMGADSLATARQIREPVTTSDDIVNAFDAITYQKGAGVLQMLERYLGEDDFREGIRRHMRRFAYGNASVEDLIDSLTVVAGPERDIAAVFESFLFQPGVPYLQLEQRCDGDGTRIKLSQRRYLPAGSPASPEQRWVVPVCMAYGQGSERAEQCVLLRRSEDEFALAGSCPQWLLPNASGAGYFRWYQDDAAMAALGDVFDTALNTGERLSYVDSLVAGVNSGAVPVGRFFDELPRIASATERSVVQAPLELYRRLLDGVIPPASQPAARTLANAAFGPRLERVARGEAAESPAEAAVLRARLTEFLAVDAEAAALREDLLQATHAFLGYPSSDLKPDPQALPADLLRAGLIVAVQTGGLPFADFLLAETQASRDANFRQAAVAALAFARDPEAVIRIRDAMHSSDIRANEYQTWLYWLLNPGSREMNWPWVQNSIDQILEHGSERVRNEASLLFGRWLCTAEDGRLLEALFEPRVDQHIGARQQLNKALESVALCVALRESQAENAAASLPARILESGMDPGQ